MQTLPLDCYIWGAGFRTRCALGILSIYVEGSRKKHARSASTASLSHSLPPSFPLLTLHKGGDSRDEGLELLEGAPAPDPDGCPSPQWGVQEVGLDADRLPRPPHILKVRSSKGPLPHPLAPDLALFPVVGTRLTIFDARLKFAVPWRPDNVPGLKRFPIHRNVLHILLSDTQELPV